MSGGNTEWKYVQSGKPGNTGGEREQRTTQQQQAKPQRQPRKVGEGGGAGRGRGGGGGSQGQSYQNQNQGYHNQQNYQNGYRQQQQVPAAAELPAKPAVDAEHIAQVMKDGKPELVQSTLLELVNQRATIDQHIVSLSDQVVQKGSQYLILEAKLKSTADTLAEAQSEREQTVSDLNNQLSAKKNEALELIQKLKSIDRKLEQIQHENQMRDRELAGANKQLEEAVRKLALSEEGLSVKDKELVQLQAEMEAEKTRVDEIEQKTLAAEEKAQNLKVNIGHKDFQNYQTVDKIRGMELHFQNQYACWNKDRQNLEQELHRLKGLTSDLMHFNSEGGNVEGAKNPPPQPFPPLGIKMRSEEELLMTFAMVIPEGRSNAKPWTTNEEALVESLLQPFKWVENYQQKFGTMIAFIRSHSTIFKEREEDRWLYRPEGMLSLPPTPTPNFPPGMLPPMPPPGFPTSNGIQQLLMMPMLNKFGGDNGLMDEMKNISNPMMQQFMMPNQNVPFPPMLVTPLAPQKQPQGGTQNPLGVEGQANGQIGQGQGQRRQVRKEG